MQFAVHSNLSYFKIYYHFAAIEVQLDMQLQEISNYMSTLQLS